MKRYLLALDQGTTSSRAILFNTNLQVVEMRQKALTQVYPKAGWVEHSPEEIFATQYSVAEELMEDISPFSIAAVGITNQRETTLVWNRHTGKPIYNAIVWQCRRTMDDCAQIKGTPLASYIRKNTGLLPDAYFSATKIRWILDHVPGARELAVKGDLLFGTVDSWLIWKLTGGKVHATDITNVSRTMLFNIITGQWDEHLLKVFGIPASMLPTVKASCDHYGTMKMDGVEIPILGVAGDQQASLFGQGGFTMGSVKNTYGTGCFMLVHTGEKMFLSDNGLLTTQAAGLPGQTLYAVEGSVFTGGAVIQWLRDEMQMIPTAAASEACALAVQDTNGVYLVPAFTGLGAPYWDMYARGIITGLTRGANRNHVVRAALESIAYQSADVLEEMRRMGVTLTSLRVDGGASANGFLMQFQADVAGVEIHRPQVIETTALGAAALAGLGAGIFSSQEEIASLLLSDRVFTPAMEESERIALLEAWHCAVKRALHVNNG